MKDDPTLHALFLDGDVRGVVFDLDGTLIDSAADILQGMRMTLEQAGLGTVPEDYFPSNLHGTAEGIIRSIVADMGWNVQPDYQALHQQYLRIAAGINLERTRLFEGALEVLDACQAAGLPMAICTNKAYAGAIAATQKFDIQNMFQFITGCDTWGEAKPSPVPLLKTIAALGVKPEECLYFGDTSTDAECAHAAGVPFVLFSAGYGDQELSRWPAHFTFSDWNVLRAGHEHTI